MLRPDHQGPQREALADVDLVVEAIVEDPVKLDLFRDLDPSAAGCHSGHDHFVAARRGDGRGHLPAPGRSRDTLLQPGADHEAGRSGEPLTTGKDVTDTVVDLCAKVGKHPVKCGDRAGFIVNARSSRTSTMQFCCWNRTTRPPTRSTR